MKTLEKHFGLAVKP